ncbi:MULTISPECIES: AraC family transcriptional regulator [unclassified Sphingomonas]|uniref:AraC family transcriptional regulator n=1 Tax=unclassified Sphingomonas TaxID=196159 RepID=UPI000BC5B5CF|nr:MAG: AraC family transcriptional regulator [Sphingomonas sp. 12-62-6]OYX38886.1 MAG: AraC family transcriptional regulator [Sphingomonas sp. 32-62-10]
MLDDLTFGWRTAMLVVAEVQLLIVAAALARTMANRTANQTLALLLLVLVGIVTPWMIGFAGFYDKWRWLSFAPFQITLGVAPLFYFYVHTLVTGTWPVPAWRHLAPPTLQFAFLTGSFLLPMPAKNAWSAIITTPYDIVTGIAAIAGMLFYGRGALALLHRYRGLLATQRSDDHRFAATWISRAIAAGAALLAVWTVYAVWDALSPLGYTGLMGLYVAIAIFALFIAIEGWRHAALPFPTIESLAIPADPTPPPRDWRALGEAWAAQVRAEHWSRDPDLSLATLARRLGTNTGHLSRALNEGLGVNFSTFINRLRCDAVAEAIAAGSTADLLDLALDAGFSSKASFNRAFQAAYGMAPSSYRRAHGSKAE